MWHYRHWNWFCICHSYFHFSCIIFVIQIIIIIFITIIIVIVIIILVIGIIIIIIVSLSLLLLSSLSLLLFYVIPTSISWHMYISVAGTESNCGTPSVSRRCGGSLMHVTGIACYGCRFYLHIIEYTSCDRGRPRYMIYNNPLKKLVNISHEIH